MNRKEVPIEQFCVKVEVAPNRQDVLFVNILENGHFNLNGKLTKELAGCRINIRFTVDYHHLCIVKGDEISVPKSGSCKLGEFAKELKANKIHLPAKYLVWMPEGKTHWQGDLIENPTLRPSKPHPASAKAH